MGGGNYSLGVKEQIVFPEIDYDKIDAIRGLDIAITTTANTDEEGRALLTEFAFPSGVNERVNEPMAKQSTINREMRRAKLVKKYRERRTTLRNTIKNPNVSVEERMDAVKKLQALLRNSSPSRLRNRCRLTGRPKGFYRKFGLGRNKLREAGDVGRHSRSGEGELVRMI